LAVIKKQVLNLKSVLRACSVEEKNFSY